MNNITLMMIDKFCLLLSDLQVVTNSYTWGFLIADCIAGVVTIFLKYEPNLIVVWVVVPDWVLLLSGAVIFEDHNESNWALEIYSTSPSRGWEIIKNLSLVLCSFNRTTLNVIEVFGDRTPRAGLTE